MRSCACPSLSASVRPEAGVSVRAVYYRLQQLQLHDKGTVSDDAEKTPVVVMDEAIDSNYADNNTASGQKNTHACDLNTLVHTFTSAYMHKAIYDTSRTIKGIIKQQKSVVEVNKKPNNLERIG